MLKLAVFDWNGTLLSDTRACLDADNQGIKFFGGTLVNLKQYRETIIIPSAIFYVKHGCNEKKIKKNIKKLGEVFHKYYEKRVAKCRGRKGAKIILEWLTKNSVKSIIISNHTVKGIEFQLQRLGMKKYILDILANSSQNASFKRRNKLEKLRKYIDAHNYKKNEIIIVGDSPEEVEIGRALGIKSVAIEYGHYSTARLRASKPYFLISNLGELKNKIKDNFI